jgi:prepilin-type N-terminal cleavage/methylation domain-containing protein/prepilin-type processing-associated H-X9-DG protein
MFRRGFTLIELIVVAAIISLLMAILAPVLRICREKSKSILCGSNIRQIGFAMIAYKAQARSFSYGFKDLRVAPPSGYAGEADYDKRGWWWFNYIGQFYDKRDNKINILQCPSKNVQNESLRMNILCGNYGVNQSICKISVINTEETEFVGQPMSSEEILYPSGTLLVVDAGYALINWWHVTLEAPQALNPVFIWNTSYVPGMRINSQKAIWPGQERDAVSGRHPNKTINVGFVDGHIETRKANELLVEKHQDKYDNRIPLWSLR